MAIVNYIVPNRNDTRLSDRGGMPELTSRRSTDAPEECWHIYYGDVHAGTIAIRSGSPYDEDPWEWTCGFYPGSHPGEHQNGTAATFDEARADFEAAWQICQSAPRRISGPGAMRGTGRRGNTPCGKLARSFPRRSQTLS
jgi:hypothetical protein